MSFQASLTFVRVDRVLTILALVGAPQRKVYGADADRVARVAAERMRGGLVPPRPSRSLWSPACPQPGQALTATRGTWTRRPAHFHAPNGNGARRTESEIGCVDLPGGDLRPRTSSHGATSRRACASSSPSGEPAPTDGGRRPRRLPLRSAGRRELRLLRRHRPSTASRRSARRSPPTPAYGRALPTEFALPWRRCHAAATGMHATDVEGATASDVHRRSGRRRLAGFECSWSRRTMRDPAARSARRRRPFPNRSRAAGSPRARTRPRARRRSRGDRT